MGLLNNLALVAAGLSWTAAALPQHQQQQHQDHLAARDTPVTSYSRFDPRQWDGVAAPKFVTFTPRDDAAAALQRRAAASKSGGVLSNAGSPPKKGGSHRRSDSETAGVLAGRAAATHGDVVSNAGSPPKKSKAGSRRSSAEEEEEEDDDGHDEDDKDDGQDKNLDKRATAATLQPLTSWPYSAMGMLRRSDGAECAATLVGPRHITTAAHCAPPPAPDGSNATGPITARFMPAYNQRETATGSAVEFVYLNPALPSPLPGDGQWDACQAKGDWAVLVLADALGDEQGYIGTSAPVTADMLMQPMFNSIGFPRSKGAGGGQQPFELKAMNLLNITASAVGDTKCDDEGPYWADGAVDPNETGNPLWVDSGNPVQWGLLHGPHANPANPRFASEWASGKDWIQCIAQVREDHP